MRRILILLLQVMMIVQGCSRKKVSEGPVFSFAFLTDMHLSMENNGCFEGTGRAIRAAEKEKVDFIITGGDNLDIDVLGNDSLRARLLFHRLDSVIRGAGTPVYPCMGNHDFFLVPGDGRMERTAGLYREMIGPDHYSFDHRGWHFIVMNSAMRANDRYCVPDDQVAWLRKDLEQTGSDVPLVVTVHVPFLSVLGLTLTGEYPYGHTFENFREVLDLFSNHNLRLVLQGHLHTYEEIKIFGIQFITSGAVSGAWWKGPHNRTQEGFLVVRIAGDNLCWEYVDYGWDPVYRTSGKNNQAGGKTRAEHTRISEDQSPG